MGETYRSPWHADQVQRWCRETLAGWALLHQTHEVDTSLGRTHLVSLGSGDRTCLYLPGTNFCAASSTVILGALATRFRVFAADLPGQPGQSAPERPGDEVVAYERWLAELVFWIGTQRGDGPLLVAGHSRGAAVALTADPATVNGVGLLSPAGLMSVRPTLPMLRATLPWLVRRDEVGAMRLLRYMSGSDHRPAPELVTWMALVARMCRTTGAPHPYPDTVVERWKGGRLIVLVGDEDVFFPAAALSKASQSKLQANAIVVAGAGHLVVDEAPELITGLLADLT